MDFGNVAGVDNIVITQFPSDNYSCAAERPSMGWLLLYVIQFQYLQCLVPCGMDSGSLWLGHFDYIHQRRPSKFSTSQIHSQIQ